MLPMRDIQGQNFVIHQKTEIALWELTQQLALAGKKPFSFNAFTSSVISLAALTISSTNSLLQDNEISRMLHPLSINTSQGLVAM